MATSSPQPPVAGVSSRQERRRGFLAALQELTAVTLLGWGVVIATGWPTAAAADEPAYFAPSANSRPISRSVSDTPSDAGLETANALRWKAKPLPNATAKTTAAKSNKAKSKVAQVAHAEGWNKSRIDPNVSPAQYSTPAADPFRDPFGDRSARGRAPSLMVAAPEEPADEAMPADESVPPGDVPETEAPMLDLDPQAETNQTEPAETTPKKILPKPSVPSRSNPAPSNPMPRNLAPRTPAPRVTPSYDLPAPADDAGETKAKCDRIYNDRDCCEVDSTIAKFREQLKNDTISKISLDISPRFLAENDDDKTGSAKRDDMIRLSKARSWANQTGTVLATGHLSNIRNGQAEITDDGGKLVARIPFNELGADELCFVAGWYRLPAEGTLSMAAPPPREWIGSSYAWHASALCHKPLYFEEVQLERYGHTAGPFKQPIVSGAHFFLNIAALPYKMAINPPTECQYALGYYRPGSCAPWHIPPVPLSLKAALVEAGVIVGGIAIIP